MHDSLSLGVLVAGGVGVTCGMVAVVVSLLPVNNARPKG